MYIAVKIRFSGMDRSELLNNNGNIILFMDVRSTVDSTESPPLSSPEQF